MTGAGTAGAKTPRASRVVMTESVLPGDGNPLGTAFGGRIAQWIDVAGAIACQRHWERAHVCSAYLTFVDQQGHPVEVPPLVLENEEDRRRQQDARRRRAVRLEHARVKRERLLAETKERG